MASVSNSFARHVCSWYAGIHAVKVAAAERCDVALIRSARVMRGRGPEYGLSPAHDHLLSLPKGASEGQLSFAETDALMRANRSVCP